MRAVFNLLPLVTHSISRKAKMTAGTGFEKNILFFLLDFFYTRIVSFPVRLKLITTVFLHIRFILGII